MLTRSAELLGVDLRPDGAAEIAGRSRGTPRIANRLLRRVRDYAEVRADGVVTEDIARAALAVYDVDELGLDRLDRAVLDALVRRFGGGPVGVGTLAVAVGEETETVEEVAEPFLVRAGLLARTPRGRVATPAAWTHLGLTPPLPAAGRADAVRRVGSAAFDTPPCHRRRDSCELPALRPLRDRRGRPADAVGARPAPDGDGRARARRAHRRVAPTVMTTSGLYGRVVAKHDDGTVTLAIAPGVEVRWEFAALRDAASLPPTVAGRANLERDDTGSTVRFDKSDGADQAG